MNFKNKINQYLLERFPTLWNTKLIWMVLIGLLVHFVFYIIGLVSHMNPTSLHTYNVLNDYFSNGLIFVHIIISILLIVGWLIFMFKNNAFKNFYPTSRWQLFGQFVHYFIILFVCTTFYYSYMLGFKSFIHSKYDDALMKEKIELTNNVYPFLSFQPGDYTIVNKRYPEIFNELYCETDSASIDFSKKYYTYYEFYYQFNSVYEKIVTERDEYGRFVYPEEEEKNEVPLAYTREQDSLCIFYFKKDVVDVSEFITNGNLNYGNFSKIFYVYGSGNFFSRSYYYSNYDDWNKDDDSAAIEQNKKTVELLQRNNPEEFRKMFAEFLEMSNQFKINHNLTVDDWMELVYHPPLFEVQKFINQYETNEDYFYPYNDVTVEEDLDRGGNTLEDIQIALRRKFEEENTTKFYYESSNLSYMFENIDNVKNSDFLKDSFSFYLWLSFIMASVIFSFRITNLKSLLFSILTGGILSLTCTLIFVLMRFALYETIQYFVSIFLLILGSVILLIPIVSKTIGTKLIRSILINLSINCFIGYVFLIVYLISIIQQDICHETYMTSDIYYYNCNTLLDTLGFNNVSYILIASGFVFLFFYTSVIKKWKASAE